MSDNLLFYQHLFEETLFLVPEKNEITTTPGAAVSAPENKAAEVEVSGETTPVSCFEILGENRKGLIILVYIPEASFKILPDSEFLQKVLASIQHTPTDVAFVNLTQGHKLNVHDLAKQTPVKNLVSFGPGLLDMSPESKIDLYTPAGIGNVTLLIADPLEHIEQDINKKRQLWQGLQATFLK